MSKSKSQSSRQWLERQVSDCYVKLAKKEGYRSRSAYKLLEIQEKDKILRTGMRVVDLGGAPGGWSQVAAELVGKTGFVLAIDLLPMEPINGVDIVHGDFQEPEVFEALGSQLQGTPVELVMSDMAPNISGIALVDQSRAMALAEMALEFVEKALVKEGDFFIKVFQGTGFEGFVADLKKRFRSVVVRKPKSSRRESREVYLLARGFLH